MERQRQRSRLGVAGLALGLAGALAACENDPDPAGADFEVHDDSSDRIDGIDGIDGIGEGLVSHHLSSGCSTAVVAPLSRQIADHMLCLAPGILERLEETADLSFRSSAVLPYLESSAAIDLRAAAAASPLVLNSCFRTVVQQLLLREWFERGRCGIPLAARPGRSNHESGRAIDVNVDDEQQNALIDAGWTRPLEGDPVHFEHASSVDLRGVDVQAFQALWNLNHPNDSLDEDGVFGSETRERLLQSPAAGFPISGCDRDG